jgi:alpha-L-fucosidase
VTSWFERARFGMFIHWDHASQRGLEISWPLVGGVGNLPRAPEVSATAYHATAETFDPRPGSARAWLDLARAAGMGYAVFTAKHHSGFAMYPTRLSDFSIARSAYAGDLGGEFVDAARERELRVGLYFSLSDWHHPDYPAWTDADRPYSFARNRRASPECWERYLEFMHGQVRELLTDYGRIDLIWFDGGWERSSSEWRAQELHDLVRSLQPEILINDRLPGFGDFDTPEQLVPAQPPGRRWETCLTMNESWAYNPSDGRYKPARDLVHALCETTGRGGNLLLNVGPRGDGSLAPEQVERLEAIARWMDGYAESIRDTEPGLEPWQLYGPSTRNGDRIFLHLLLRPYETVTLRGVPIRRVAGARELRSGAALEFETRCAAVDRLFSPDPLGEVAIRVPESLLDPLATVIEVELAPAALERT